MYVSSFNSQLPASPLSSQVMLHHPQKMARFSREAPCAAAFWPVRLPSKPGLRA